MKIIKMKDEKQYIEICKLIENNSRMTAMNKFKELHDCGTEIYKVDVTMVDSRYRELLATIPVYSFDESVCVLEELDDDTLNLLWNVFIDRNRGFDVFEWRKQQGLINDLKIVRKREIENSVISSEVKKEWNVNMLLQDIIGTIPAIGLDEVQLYFDHIEGLHKKNQVIYRKEIRYRECCCLDFPLNNFSVVYIENYGTGLDFVCNVCHEIGHAIFNFFKRREKIIVDVEVDEFVAHFLEYLLCTYSGYCSRDLWEERMCQMINFEIVSTNFLSHLFTDEKKYRQLKEKEKLFCDLCKQYQYSFDSHELRYVLRNGDYLYNPFGSTECIIPQKKVLGAIDILEEICSLGQLLDWVMIEIQAGESEE